MPRHTHLYALDAEVQVDAGQRLDGGRRGLQAEGGPQRQLARSPVVGQPSAAVVPSKTLAAAIHAASRGAARRPVYGEGNITDRRTPRLSPVTDERCDPVRGERQDPV